jgi:hypothetical protein
MDGTLDHDGLIAHLIAAQEAGLVAIASGDGGGPDPAALRPLVEERLRALAASGLLLSPS